MVLSIDVPYGRLSASAEGKVLVSRPSGGAAPIPIISLAVTRTGTDGRTDRRG
jgi:hypothetical protein